ncbi:hypothetical protein [Oceanirhabdus sp. W0125-5]|uniref:hypothetical protein n=1 Tax=Oceanirhabdus sp. W0125-5 TaxID=2999116 RepID=UPI0022F2CAA3|nr:hypothetical protein [Oceanirhabdus sp. W0125-5]WBW95065.1 hypothetical protein OW730_15370 [Oceanirhabdus sp. W0125-5]
MRIKANKFAFIYASLPALGGFIGASFAGKQSTNLILGFIGFTVVLWFIFGISLIKEIEVQGSELIIRKFFISKEKRINNILDIDFSKGKINVSTTDGKNFELNSKYFNENDLKEFNEYVVAHVN